MKKLCFLKKHNIKTNFTFYKKLLGFSNIAKNIQAGITKLLFKLISAGATKFLESMIYSSTPSMKLGFLN